MPVYGDPERRDLFDLDLLELLEAKSCFHLRRPDDAVMGMVDDALRRGLDLYRERGCV